MPMPPVTNPHPSAAPSPDPGLSRKQATAVGPSPQPVVDGPAMSETRSVDVGPAVNLTLQEIQARWSDIMRVVKTRSVPTEALLKSCHVINIEGATVILSWPTDHLKSKFESGKGQHLVEDVMSEALDQKIMLRSMVDDPMIRAAVQLGAKVTPVQNR
jgi:hypothetical protein